MSDTQPVVSVVMIVLDGAAWIGRQLDALARQRDAPSWELMVADNGSTDATLDIVREKAAGFPVPLRLVDASDARGASHARTVAASVARAPLFVFCDCDDMADEHWIREAARALEVEECVGGLIRALQDPHDPQSEVRDPTGLHGRGIDTCNFAVRRDLFFAVGGFDESLPPYGVEDSEFSLRVLNSGVAIRPALDMVTYFRATSDVRKTAAKIYESAMAETVVWQRHPGVFERPLNLRTVVLDLVRWPLTAVRHMKGGGSARTLARSAVTTWGHLIGYVTWVRNGRADAARLAFEPFAIPDARIESWGVPRVFQDPDPVVEGVLGQRSDAS